MLRIRASHICAGIVIGCLLLVGVSHMQAQQANCPGCVKATGAAPPDGPTVNGRRVVYVCIDSTWSGNQEILDALAGAGSEYGAIGGWNSKNIPYTLIYTNDCSLAKIQIRQLPCSMVGGCGADEFDVTKGGAAVGYVSICNNLLGTGLVNIRSLLEHEIGHRLGLVEAAQISSCPIFSTIMHGFAGDHCIQVDDNITDADVQAMNNAYNSASVCLDAIPVQKQTSECQDFSYTFDTYTMSYTRWDESICTETHIIETYYECDEMHSVDYLESTSCDASPSCTSFSYIGSEEDAGSSYTDNNGQTCTEYWNSDFYECGSAEMSISQYSYTSCSSGGCNQSSCSSEEIDYCHSNGIEAIWDSVDCQCTCGETPIVINTRPGNIELSAPDAGVIFDLSGNGAPKRYSWPKAGSGIGFLVLDRNGNGRIDDGKELFGNAAAQGDGPNRNGFLALAEFDKAANGGNGDGLIDSRDSVFGSLRIWIDENRNGISESEELFTLQSLGISAISLDYRLSKKRDRFGNIFRYRSSVTQRSTTKRLIPWAWDVILVSDGSH